MSSEAGEDVAAYLYVVTHDGLQVEKIGRATVRATEMAWLDDKVTPHTLRHTRAKWLMRSGVHVWEAANVLGMSPKTLTEDYGHRHPDWHKKAAQV